jgi:hypothetical protein
VGGSLETEVQVFPESRLSSISTPKIEAGGVAQVILACESPATPLGNGDPKANAAAVAARKAASDLKKRL